MTTDNQNLRWPKAFAKLKLAPGEIILWQGRPSWASNWVMILGFFLGLAIPFQDGATEVHPFFWLLMAGVFAAIAWSRRRQFYLLTSRRLMKSSQFGGGHVYELALKNLRNAVPRQGLSGRASRTGHVFVDSWSPGEAALGLLGQPRPEDLAARIRAAALAEGAELEG